LQEKFLFISQNFNIVLQNFKTVLQNLGDDFCGILQVHWKCATNTGGMQK
jgi:hypothetical protein